MSSPRAIQPEVAMLLLLARYDDAMRQVFDTMDISRAATIKTSRMEVYEPIDALNDAKIDDAHISLMVSVRVMSRITNLKGSAKFLPIDGIEAGSPRFNEAFRDSYISGMYSLDAPSAAA
ncbi:hypothetical protein HZS61_015864 [Fusarium oxysporum f. sp. conglutinans]|uniref:Uncharacterized protein n=1 Tax=Fusarium oxysporum f. sp. conglutinans TaxID=100902 RepID=A0A8H6GQH9_FUSOX|nr:hypothetical protein HZS61_015864 [Fusarium oxysporum f. sp. conglutinans]